MSTSRTRLLAARGLARCWLSLRQAQAPRNGGELVFPVPSEPPSYDGHREETFGLIHPIAPLYNTLLRVDPNDKTGTKPVAVARRELDGLAGRHDLHLQAAPRA